MNQIYYTSPIDFRYLLKDGELKEAVDRYASLNILSRLRRIIPEVLIPRFNSLEFMLLNIADKNRQVVIPRRVNGKHEGTVNIRDIFKGYAERLEKRSQDIRDLPLDFEILEGARLNDRISDLAYFSTSAFSILANIAEDTRQLFRSEIEEVAYEESTLLERVGSSTMPHKVNPAEYEQIKSLWKHYLSKMPSAILSQIVEHQGDSTNDDFPYHAFELLAALGYATKSLESNLKTLKINIP